MKPQDIDVSGVEVTALKKLDNGANVAYVNYNGKPIYITTPELEVPFDSQWWPSSEGDSSGKWSMKANLRGEDCKHLISLFQKMDTFLKISPKEIPLRDSFKKIFRGADRAVVAALTQVR